jgi:hypothetical protein
LLPEFFLESYTTIASMTEYISTAPLRTEDVQQEVLSDIANEILIARGPVFDLASEGARGSIVAVVAVAARLPKDIPGLLGGIDGIVSIGASRWDLESQDAVLGALPARFAGLVEVRSNCFGNA